jgi:hypothetical protein
MAGIENMTTGELKAYAYELEGQLAIAVKEIAGLEDQFSKIKGIVNRWAKDPIGGSVPRMNAFNSMRYIQEKMENNNE